MARQWYPRYPNDFERDTKLLSWQARGIYSLMLDLYWQNQGPLPKNLSTIANALGVPRVSFRRVFGRELAAFFEEKDGKLWNKRMDKVIEESARISKVKAESGKRGGLANAKANATANAEANGVACYNYSRVSSTGVHNSTTSRGQKSDAHTPFPYDQWDEVPHSWVAVITNAGHAYQAEKVFLNCRDHYRMRHETASDWLSAWKKWVRGQRHTSDGKAGKSNLTQSDGQFRNDHDLQSVGAKLGINARPGESWDEYRIRVIEARERQARGG